MIAEPLPKLETAAGRPLRRALALMEVLARADGPMSLSDLARRTGEPKSSVHRILGVLTDLNLAAQADGGFVVGGYLSDMTRHSDHGRAEQLRRALTPLLMDLQDRTRGVVLMGVLDGTHVRYVELLYRGELSDYVQSQPLLQPASATATGHALLAFRPDLLDRVDEFAACTGTSPTRLLVDLQSVRKRGIAVVTKNSAHGGAAVAMPVRIGDDRPFISLGVAYPGRIDLPRTTLALRRAVATAGAIATAQPCGPVEQRSAG